MKPVLTANQVREIDRLTVDQYNVPSLVLMESAAEACVRAVASRVENQLEGKTAQVLCGPGNNGGDGAALARILANLGMHVDVILFGNTKNLRGDAKTNFDALNALASFTAGSRAKPAPLVLTECENVAAWEEIARPRRFYDVIVDALFGTGLSRPLEGLFLQVVEHLRMIKTAREIARGIRPLILSIDIPSGLNADLSNPIGAAVESDVTVTFTAAKAANVLPPASQFCGEVIVANIGSPTSLVEAANPRLFLTEASDASEWLKLTRYQPDSHKNSHGHVLVIAGSSGYTGAAALCANAAMRSGAGLVTAAVPSSAQVAIASRLMPEVMTIALADTDRGAISDVAVDHAVSLAADATATAIGPGLASSDERTRKFVYEVVSRRSKPVVIDADALNCLAPWPKDLRGSDEAPLILTPHVGELARLVGSDKEVILKDRIETIRQFATSGQLYVVLKGARALMAMPDGRIFINPTGNAGLGTAGAGDTLTGLIVGFVAQAFATAELKADTAATTAAALFVAGRAGDLAASKYGMRCMVASDVREMFCAAVQSLDSEGEQPN
ncbi:MAG TPA: NAD(P)H-hydrate dehydratase [Pyrinomonadaceae bacterium]|nr:NAD(P)H-hydrate dehydratase [Pyrinomonadaceae bacterium]